MSNQLRELKRKRSKLESIEHETSFEEYKHCALVGCKCKNRFSYSYARIGKIVPSSTITDEEWAIERKEWLKREARTRKRMGLT